MNEVLYFTAPHPPALNRFLHIVPLFLLPLTAPAQQYYLKGEVKDEKGNFLQNVNILQCSSGYVYHSGLSGSFGILTNKKRDTLTFFIDGYHRLRLPVNAADYISVTLKKLPPSRSTSGYKLSSLTHNLKREIQQQWFTGDETYASLIENRFVDVSTYPTTGLTLNVDRASYSNVRRFLNMNSPVPPDAVRIEEMLNYFNVYYTEPPENKTFDIRTALTNCPWNPEHYLFFANICSKRMPLDKLPPSHFVFLIDVSGSMDMPNRLPLLKAGFRGLVRNLRPIDSVAIVVYGGTVGVMLNTTSGAEKEKIFNVIDSLTPGGSTPGESGIKLAYSVARNHFIKGGNNRVILATDGDFNVGLRTETELEEMILAQQKAGIYLTCLGVGMGNYKDSKIQTLAEKGNGNFAYLDSYAEAEKVLLKEFAQTLYVVAEDVYLNVSFNRDFVKEYRVIGFDNKVGALKDTSAAVEGGEISSAYSLLVAFEIEPAEAAKEAVKYNHVFKPATFTLKYKLPQSGKAEELRQSPSLAFQPLPEVNADYRFATAVILFGSLLRQSKFVKEATWNDAIALADTAVNKANPLQAEFLQLLQQAKTLYSKKKRKKEDFY